MERNLALELVRVTEAAALASARWMGKGDAAAADMAARDAVALVMKSIKVDGRVVIGDTGSAASRSKKRGEKAPRVDVALDALQAARSVADGAPNALAVIAVASPGAFFEPPLPYMNKVAVGPDAVGAVNIKASPLENLVNIADAKRCYVEDLTVCILERERHDPLIDQVRETGARIQLIRDGDLAAAMATAIPGSGVDVLMGVGGSAEGVLAAAALKCVGGDMQAQMYVRGEEDAQALRAAEYGRRDRVLKLGDLIGEDDTMFAATGVTNSGVVSGVQFIAGGAITYSVVMRARSGTVRYIEAHHSFDRKPDYR